MKSSKRLLGAAGLSMVGAALFTGAGTAAADGPITTTDVIICGETCFGGGPVTAFAKIGIIAFKYDNEGSIVAAKLNNVLQKLNTSWTSTSQVPLACLLVKRSGSFGLSPLVRHMPR